MDDQRILAGHQSAASAAAGALIRNITSVNKEGPRDRL
jgi:hypothetical protein